MQEARKKSGFSTAAVLIGMSVLGMASLVTWEAGGLIRSWSLRAEARQLAVEIKKELHQSREQDVDHRIRVETPQSYVIEHRMGAGWGLDRKVTLPAGFSIQASRDVELPARGLLVPEVVLEIANKSDHAIVTVQRNGEVESTITSR